MPIICGKKISYVYEFDGMTHPVLDELDITIESGEFIVVLGRNGSGKSTLAKHCNALLRLQRGDLEVSGINARCSKVWQLRKVCGMVFQNPDNQFVSSVIGEDIAFGLENYEVPRELIAPKVKNALHLVGLSGFEEHNPHTLSGGQKQRAALAGVLAIEPEILIFDEATAMLDPEGRREMLKIIQCLSKKGKKTVIMITHYAEDAVFADRVFLIDKGRTLANGTPRTILGDEQLMQDAGLIPPMPVRLYHDLKRAGIMLCNCPLTDEELVEELCALS